ncbi:hypothetical protein D3C72_2078020 [compost metagenome]
MRMTSIFSPWMPPWALAASITSCAPPMVSFTLAATEPVMPAVWPITIWAEAPIAHSASRAATPSACREPATFFFVMKAFRSLRETR